MTDRAARFPAEALPLLRCPICGAGFATVNDSLRCANGHSYDIARQGYVNLLPGDARPGTADTAGMVAARDAFLGAGHFSGLRDFVCDVAGRAGGAHGAGALGAAGEGCIVEIGAGTGYYLSGVLDHFPGRLGLALDISKFAARRAARAHERLAAIVCDAWGPLPVADGCASLVLDIFAPRNPSEFRRVLRPNAALLVVTPSPRHLTELTTTLGLLSVDERKPERLEQAFATDFVVAGRDEYEERRILSPAEAGALVAMGPSAHHVPAEELAARLAAFGDAVDVTLSVVATTYVARPA